MTHRVAILGAGIGAQHLAAFAALPDEFRVTTVCDLDQERGKTLAEQYGASFTSDLAGVLGDPMIDIVDICLPPHLHARTCIDALEAGKKVICEKPLAGSLAEVDELAKKLEETNGFLSPVFQYRFGLGSNQLQQLIDRGLAGRCYAGTLETHWDRPSSYYDVAWRGTWEGEQGGAILGHAIHIHDLLQSFLGPVSSVYAHTATRVNEIETEDCATLSILMQEGALISSSVTLGSAENISRMRLMFEGFTVESDHAPYSLAAKDWTFVARAPARQAEIDAVLASVPAQRAGYVGMFSEIAKTLNGGRGRHVKLEDARRSIEFVTAVYASARSGGAVKLPLGTGHALYRGWMP